MRGVPNHRSAGLTNIGASKYAITFSTARIGMIVKERWTDINCLRNNTQRSIISRLCLSGLFNCFPFSTPRSLLQIKKYVIYRVLCGVYGYLFVLLQHY